MGTTRIQREKSIRLPLSEEEYAVLQEHADEMRLPMLTVLRLYIRSLKPRTRKGTDINRDKNVRVILSQEEYEELLGEADDLGIPMTGVLRLYIRSLKPEAFANQLEAES